MLAAATGDHGLVEIVKKAGVTETPDAEPYMEILAFQKNADSAEYRSAVSEIAKLTGKLGGRRKL